MNSHRVAYRILVIALTVGLGTVSEAQQSPTAKDQAFEEQFERGRQSLKAGNYKDAINALKKANKLHQDSCGVCYYVLALAYLHARQMDEGLKSCDKAIATAGDDPSRAAAHNLRGDALLTLAGTDKKTLLSAQDEYRTAVRLDKKTPLYHMNLAKALLRQSQDAEAKEELESCLALNPDARTVSQVQLLLADPRRARYEFAPEFEILTLQGQQITLRQLAGRIVVVDFWATWCPPCRASVSELKDLTKRYPISKLVLISVSGDEDERAWRDFIEKKGMDWAQYRDVDRRVLNSFGINAFPTYLVIDGDGIIRQRITGLNPQESVVHRLKATLEQMPQLEGEIHK
jgi:tetratricopeptide (TPR) repeat protein